MDSRIKKESLIYGVSKYTTVIVTLLTSAVLARILSPEEFGVVSVVTVFTALFAVISDMGLGTAVIQEQGITKDEIDSVFSFSVYASAAMALLFFALGYLVAAFYEDRIYRLICAILSISVLFNSLNIIPNAVLMKQKRFALVGQRLIITSIVTGTAAVVMALRGFSYYALIFQSVLQSVFIFAWNVISTKVHFKLKFDFSILNRIKKFSVYQFVFSIINYFARNADNLLVGKVMGKASLGYYDKGYRLMMYPVQNLTYVINPLVHPVLSVHQNDKEYIYGVYKKEVMALSYLGVFISAACFLCSREIILLFFGPQWETSIPLFRILSLSVWPQIVSSSAGSIYQSTGNTKLMFRSGMIHFSLAVLLIVVGVFSKSLIILSALVSTGLLLRFFIDYYFLIVKDFRYPYKNFLCIFRNDLIAAICMIPVILLCFQMGIQNNLLSLAVKGILILAVYLGVSLATGEAKEVYKILVSPKR